MNQPSQLSQPSQPSQPSQLSQLSQPVLSIIGLGYVGLPLAQAFSRSFKVIAFDRDSIFQNLG